MTTKNGDVKLLEQCLQDFKSRAQEMKVGVNFSALDEERHRQEHLLRELQEIEAELTAPTLSKTNLPHLASLVGAELDKNTRCLHYLTGISELERYVTDVAVHFAERSIELSDPQALDKKVFISKTLSDNVKSCWEYVDQLAMLTQIHIKTAAEYHQFFHEANEVEAKLEKHLRLAQRRQHAMTGQEGNLKDVSKIANELREQLESMRSLWNRCIALVRRSKSVVPMRLRMGGVSRSQVILDVANGQSGPIMVRALISLTGPNYRIQQGDLLPLIDNQKNTYLWKVQTSSGVVEVPSICFWVMGNDAEATERAVVLKQQCKKVWLEIIRLSRQRLYHEYIDILSQLTAKNVTCTKQELLDDLVAEIHNHLITQLDDKGRLQTVVENFQRSVIDSRQRIPEEGLVLRESDLVRLRSPLMRLEDHLMAVGLMQEDMEKLNEYIENYLSEVTTEQNRIAKMVEQLERITTESQTQLADLVSHLAKFTASPSEGSQAIRPKMDTAYRSRSQPFDFEFKKNLKEGGGGGKRARSQTIHLLDAMVQIGTGSKSAETQCLDTTSVTDPPLREPKDIAIQLNARKPPVQRCVITQIGPSNKETCTQVDISDSSYSEDCYVAEDMKGIVKRSSKEVISDRRRKARSVSGLPRRPPVVQVNTCTQLGLMTHERSVSPIHSLPQFCPNCQKSEIMEVQKEYEEIISGSQHCQPVAYGLIQSEMHGNHICKRVQCGFPCLKERSNLYCQVDVLGRLMDDAAVQSRGLRCYTDIGTIEEVFEVDQEAFCETRFAPSRCHLVCKRVQTGMPKMCGLADSFSQTMRTRAHPICDHIASATQIGIMTRERECSPVLFEDVVSPAPLRHQYIQARARQPKVHKRGHTVIAEASRIMDWDSTATSLQMTHNENLYVEPIRRDLYEMDYSGAFVESSTLQSAIIGTSSPELDRIARKGVFSVNSHIGLRSRDGRFETRHRQHKAMLRAASTEEVEYPIEARASASLCHIASSPDVITQPVDRRTARLQTKSLPNLLEEESQIGTQSTDLSFVKVESTRSTYNDVAHRSRYATLQAISGPMARRKTVRVQSGSLPNVIDSEVQIGHAVDLAETQTSEFINFGRFSKEKLVGSCSANAKHVQQAHSLPGVVDGYMHTNRRSVGRSLVEKHISEVPVRQYSAQACRRVPDVAIAEISQHAVHMPDVGIAEVQIHPTVYQDNKKVQVHTRVSNPVRLVCVETPSIVQYDVSCDAMIRPPRASKKAQAEVFEEPILAVPVKEPNIYAAPPVPKITSNVAIQMSESMKAVTTQSTPEMYDKEFQCEPPLPRAVVSCQQNPQTSNKKLQVSVHIPTDVRLGGAEVSPASKTTYGKKLQVDFSGALLTSQTQTISEPEPEPILVSAPILQYSAPPTAFEDFSCDAPKPVEVLSNSTQSDPTHVPETLGKKLQVRINETLESSVCQSFTLGVDSFTQFEPEPLAVGVSQSIWEEPEPLILKPPTPAQVVMAAPPPSGIDDGCDPIQAQTTESSSQAEKMETFGKKLQVTPEPYSTVTLNTRYELPITQTVSTQVKPVQTVGRDVQIKPDSLTLCKTQTVWIEEKPIMLQQERTPVYSAPPKETKDFECDPNPPPQKSIYTEPRATLYEYVNAQAWELEKIGKKLQVGPEPLAVTVAQAIYVEPKLPMYELYAAQSRELEKMGKKLQVGPEPLSTAIVQGPQETPHLAVNRCQVIYTEPCLPTYASSTAQCEHEELVVVQTVVVEPYHSVYRTAFSQSKYFEDIGRIPNVEPEPLAVAFTQCAVYEPELAYIVATEQSGSSKTFSKMVQVEPLPLAIAGLQASLIESELGFIGSQTFGHIVVSDSSAERRDFSSSTIAHPMVNASVQVSSSMSVAHGAVDTLPPPKHLTKKLQAIPEPLGVAAMQSIDFESSKPMILPLSVGHSQTFEESVPLSHRQLQISPERLAVITAQAVGVKSFGKKLQVQPIGLAGTATQTSWEESVVIKASTPEPTVMAAPPKETFQASRGPLPEHTISTLVQAEIQPTIPKVEKFNKKLMVRPQSMKASEVQATIPKVGLTSMEIQSEVPLPLQPTEPSLKFKEIQAYVDSLKVAASQTKFVEQSLIIQRASSPAPLYAAPTMKETFDFGTQYEHSVRSVRIQKGAGALEDMVHIGIHDSLSEPRRSPLGPRVHKIEWGIQCKPTVMVGITQTAIVEHIPRPGTPQTYTESTQTEYVAPPPSITKIEVIHKPIEKRKESEPLFSFVRETTTHVSKARRAKSHGLIPFKTQVATQEQDYSLSVPSMLHLNVLEQGTATMTEQYSYQQQRSTSMNIPRRYSSRIRSPSVRGATYDRRNRSMDTIFEDLRTKHMQDSLPRHSEGDLHSENAYVEELLRTQQIRLEERTEENLQRCVQAVGFERVYAMLRQIWKETEEEKAIYEEIHNGFYTSRTFPGRRYNDVTTQYSIPSLGFHRSYGRRDAAIQEGISHVQWIPLPPGHLVHIESDESTDIDETYDWDPDLTAWHPRRNLFKWLARTPLDFGTQTEVTKAEENQYIDRLLRSRALSAYTSDFEMQQAGLKLNYPESGTVSVVSWRPRYLDGEDQLDVDTIGQLLRISLVGARVPGTGEVISAADAFYRGILRMVYVDDTRGTIMPLPTAITANAVIVEKQYPRGVGIALHSTSRKYPVECQVLWNTATLRRRTYRVNFIQKSTEERVDLSTALAEGLIDLTSGELIKISVPSTSTLPDPLLESRESTLGAGDTTPIIPQPERYNVHEAILNDILNVDLLAPEAVIFPSTEVIQEGVAREGEGLFPSPGPEEESDMEV
ncbi:hypothetical protein TcWFU_003437 [Taenia crassiceps]|uniref:Desmoplakin SH3 domain-containing protein n=1 Tax=Taenia crassiceps TaxID=6207 RepID=A0ABR4QD89_9CEST